KQSCHDQPAKPKAPLQVHWHLPPFLLMFQKLQEDSPDLFGQLGCFLQLEEDLWCQ
uniref:Uncharacterized protein n=1 Tax=Chelonoidis abingdonii TaxID=106734 RepID=A0A8C0IWI1_CHEAB